jgi:hypothetical protein
MIVDDDEMVAHPRSGSVVVAASARLS